MKLLGGRPTKGPATEAMPGDPPGRALPWLIENWRATLKSVAADGLRELPAEVPVLLQVDRQARIGRYSIEGQELRFILVDSARSLPYFDVEVQVKVTMRLRRPITEAELLTRIGLPALVELAQPFSANLIGLLVQQMGLPPARL